MVSSTEVTAQARTGTTEDALLAASHRELDALFRGSPAGRWFARLAVAVDDRRWDRFSTWVGIALIKGIRDNMRQHNLFDTNDTDRPEVYTPEGMRWIDDNDMLSVPTRHHPDLAPVLRNVDNAFASWPLLGGAGAPPAQVR